MIIFIDQDILAYLSVIIIDPKGDKDIRNAVYFSYKKRSGDTKGIFEFDLAYPERSIHLDLFSNVLALQRLRQEFATAFQRKLQIQNSARWENLF